MEEITPVPLGSTTPKQCIYQVPHMSSAGLSPRCQQERLLTDTRCRVLAPSLLPLFPSFHQCFLEPPPYTTAQMLL